MHDRRKVVDTDPLGTLLAFHIRWEYASFIFYTLLYALTQSAHLRHRVSLADDEILRRPVFHLSQVKLNNVLSFDIGNAVNNDVIQCFIADI